MKNIIKSCSTLMLFLTISLSIYATTTETPQERTIQLIQRINVEKHRYVVIPKYEDPLWGHFIVEYQEEEDLDLRKLDRSILSIPFILSTAPFIWGSGKTYTIKTMDEDLYYSLEKLHIIFKLFFPSHTWSGKLIPEKLKKNFPQGCSDKTALLFSGGLDAVCASFGHLPTSQFLITVCGNDVKIKEKDMWNNVKNQCKEFALTYGHTNGFIRSNFREFLKETQLAIYCKDIEKAWQEALTALCLTSIAAPLLLTKGYTQLHLGATRTIDFPHPFGTHPLLDNNIAFAGVQIFHDQPDFDRVDKIRFIDQQAKKHTVPHPYLRVCFTKRLQQTYGTNCSKCEKCLRTINEIIVLGINPELFGFEYNEEQLIARTKALLKGKRLTEGEIWHWQCVQKEILNNSLKRSINNKQLHDYFSWLAYFDMTKLYKHEKERLAKISLKKPRSTKLWELGQRGLCTLEDLTQLTSQLQCVNS